MTVALRPYQSLAIQQIRDAFTAGFKAPLYVSPTGSGKTTVFAAIAESSQQRDKRVLILCHRVELVDQIVDRLREFDVQPDIIAAGYQRSAGRFRAANRAVSVASVQTLVRRLNDYAAPTLIVIDEAHHTCAGSWDAILRKYPDAKRLGVTATPIRGDSRGLAAYFDKLIAGPSVQELTDLGFLAPARVFAPPTVDTSGLHIRMGEYKSEEAEALMNKPAITGDALSHYRKLADGKPALVFCTSVKHAHDVAAQFRDGGVAALALDGGTDRDIRRMAVSDFRRGAIRVLTSCSIFCEGFDCPGVHAGIMLRPTASEGLWKQMVGRILRPAPGKTHALIADHVNGSRMWGLPADPREWELTSDVVRRKKSAPPGVRVCDECFAASPARALVCIECGVAFKVKPRAVEEREGELVEVTAEELARKKERQMQGRASTRQQLLEIARIKGRNPAWVDHVLRGREAKARKKESA